MGDGFGLGGGNNDLSRLRALTEIKLAESQAQGRQHDLVETGRWPGAGTVVRVLILAVVVIVILGWVLTAVNG